MATFKNLNEFYSLIQPVASETLTYIGDTTITELDKNIIAKGIGTGNGSYYHATGEFMDGFDFEPPSSEGDVFKVKINYDGSRISSHDPENFIHGSNYFDGGNDARDYLPELIFEGNSGDLFGKGFWTNRRDAWSPTMSRLDRSLNKLVIDGMSRSGFKIKKV